MATLLFLLALVIWALFPLYGFVSHQFGMLQTPFGWQALPTEPAPTYQWVADAGDSHRAEQALSQLAERRSRIGAPSISAAIVQHGKLRWTGAVGWADIDRKLAATADTKYRIGSTSKAITATLLARMVDAGIVSPELDMAACLTRLPNTHWGPLTLRQLASHTAGITGYEENRDLFGLYRSMALQSRFTNSTEALSVFDGSDLLFEPGTGFHYSSYDFVLIAACLEAKGNKPYHKLLDGFVTEPLEIDNLDVDGIRSSGGDIAEFYLGSDAGYRPWRSVDLSHKAAGGGIVATPARIARIGASWLDNSYTSHEVRELFWTPVILANGEVNEQDYALGWRRKTWMIDGVGKVENLNHGGVSKGSQFWLMVVPEHDLSLVVAMNGLTDEFFDFADVSAELLSIFLQPEYVNRANGTATDLSAATGRKACAGLAQR